MKEAHQLEKEITNNTLAYLKTPAGVADYKKRFPNDNETNILRRTSNFLGYYVDWTGRGSKKKYEELSGKIKHPREKGDNFGLYVGKAKDNLAKRAVDLDLALQQAQPPTSNNNVSNFSLSL